MKPNKDGFRTLKKKLEGLGYRQAKKQEFIGWSCDAGADMLESLTAFTKVDDNFPVWIAHFDNMGWIIVGRLKLEFSSSICMSQP